MSKCSSSFRLVFISLSINKTNKHEKLSSLFLSRLIGLAQDPMSMSMMATDPMAMSLGPDELNKSLAQDPMTMSVFGSFNGMNGDNAGEQSPSKPESPVESLKLAPETKEIGARPIPGTNMRCLDDPSFMFDQQKEISPDALLSQTKIGGMRVLEAPVSPPSSKKSDGQPSTGGMRVLEAPASPPSSQKSTSQPPTGGVRVLEAPESPPSSQKSSSQPPAGGVRVLDAPESPPSLQKPTSQSSAAGVRVLDAPESPPSSQKPTSHSSTAGVRVLEAPESPPSSKKPISQPPASGMRVLEAPESPSAPRKSTGQPPTNVHENPVASNPNLYRVLEAPLDDITTAAKGTAPYRILEAPSYPSQSGTDVSQETPALVSPTSGRTVAEALDKARSRFDSFWGGGKEKDPPSNV